MSNSASARIMNRILNTGILVSVATVLFTALFQKEKYEFIFILPMMFCISLVPKYTRRSIATFLCIRLYYVLLFVTYVITPLLLTLTGYISVAGIEPSNSAINTAIFLLAYIRVVLMIVTESVAHKSINRFVAFSENSISQDPSQSVVIFFYACVLLIVAIGIFLGGYYSDYRWFWEETTRYVNATSNTSIEILFRFCAILLHCSVPMIVIFLTRRSFEKNILTRVFTYIICVFTICLVRGDNRLMIVVLCLSTLCYLNAVHPRFRAINNMVVASISIASIVIVTLMKSFSNPDYSGLYSLVRLLQMYVPTPRDVGLSVDIANSSNFLIRLSTIPQDYIGSINIIGKLGSFFSSQSSNSLYNLYVSAGKYYGDAFGQIMMISGQGYYHFGFILAPVYEIIIIKIIFKCDTYIASAKKDSLILYSVFYVGFLTAFAPCLSISGYMQTLSWGGGALLLILFLFNKYKVRFGR